jgi:4-diphosphocytidyl-2-C-methyl-D-erythritol kinase
MRIAAPAKINLHLRIGPLRADGFHPLLSWMTTIGLRDTITLSSSPGSKEIALTCSDPTLPCDDRNIVMKAAKLLRGQLNRSVAIHLEKQIPHGGGLGGGSSDAAHTLRALDHFWELRNSVKHLHELAGQLGSDVPFFLHGPSSVCKGRGELVKPIASPALARWVLLILPALSMPTPAVYRKFDQMKLGQMEDIEHEPAWNRLANLSSQDLLRELVNDLEAPAFAIEPTLGKLRADIEQTLGRIVRMSGSGSSLFTLFDTKEEAETAAARIGRDGLRALAVEMTPG